MSNMRRLTRNKRSKRAITLVELVVAMTLTSIFAATCVMLMVPIVKIYTHEKELSRAQLVADSVVDAVRAECAKTYITCTDDVWISSSIDDAVYPSIDNRAPSGCVLVIRRNNDHCETIASHPEYSITGPYTTSDSMAGLVYEAEAQGLESDQRPQTGGDGTGVVSRAVYRLTNVQLDPQLRDAAAGRVHFGYFVSDPNATGAIVPTAYFDYTSPLSFATYGDYAVSLFFHDIELTTTGSYPAYVLCDVKVFGETGTEIYSRDNVVLCFASHTFS